MIHRVKHTKRLFIPGTDATNLAVASGSEASSVVDLTRPCTDFQIGNVSSQQGFIDLTVPFSNKSFSTGRIRTLWVYALKLSTLLRCVPKSVHDTRRLTAETIFHCMHSKLYWHANMAEVVLLPGLTGQYYRTVLHMIMSGRGVRC